MSPSDSIRAIVFDFDGTLVDSNAVKRNAYDAAFARHPGAPVHIRQTLARYRDRDRHFIIRAVARRLVNAGQIAPEQLERVCWSATRRYSWFCRTHVEVAPDFRGVGAALAALSRRYSLAINSGTPERQLRFLVRKRRWGRRCSLVYGAPSSKLANLQRIARKLNLEPRQMALVGDSDLDASAAMRFGCLFIHAGVGETSPLRGALSIRTMKDLPRLTRRLSTSRA